MGAPNTVLLDLAFGIGGNADACMFGHWCPPENGLCWALSPSCSMRFELKAEAQDAVLLLDTWPALAPGQAFRRLRILRAGQEIAQFESDARACRAVTLGRIASHQPVTLDFEFDPALPLGEDTRPLGFAFRALRVIDRSRVANINSIHLPPLTCDGNPDLPDSWRNLVWQQTELGLDVFLLGFESLGHSCDFGSFQRECGAEPLGLLRFSGLPSYGLIEGLFERFGRLGKPGTLDAKVMAEWGNEYIMLDRNYNMTWHTFLHPPEAAPEQLLAREAFRLPRLRERFLNILDNASKIFVLRWPRPMPLDEALAVAEALRVYADATLLWGVEKQGLPGSVDVLEPYLLRGHLDAATAPGASSFGSWLSVCLNTSRYIKAARC